MVPSSDNSMTLTVRAGLYQAELGWGFFESQALAELWLLGLSMTAIDSPAAICNNPVLTTGRLVQTWRPSLSYALGGFLHAVFLVWLLGFYFQGYGF